MKKKIKRFFSAVSALTITLASIPITYLPAVADDEIEEVISGTCGENLTWSFDSELNVLTIEGTGNMQGWYRDSDIPWYSLQDKINKVILPDGITDIGESAFSNCINLTSVEIPESVTSIGYGSFDHCESLTDITIPHSVTSIGNYAFSYCYALTDFTFPDSITSFGKYIFYGCTGLTCVTLPDNVTSIPEGLLYHCESLTDFSIPESVTSIGSGAFQACKSMTSITIPNSVTSIGDYAFNDCTSIDNIIIPKTVTDIGTGAFFRCSSLTAITLPDGVTSIGDDTFYYCKNLKDVTIPDSVTSIGEEAFRDCKALPEITIPDSVTSIGYNAFYHCDSLSDIYISENVTSIGGDAFTYTPWLKAKQEEAPLVIVNEILIDGTTCTGSVTLPDGLTTINPNAFKNCEGITGINIPSSVTSIGYSAFEQCEGLTEIIIPNSVTNIGSAAFKDCKSLTDIVIPEGVTSIGYQTFYNCSGLNSITVRNRYCGIYDKDTTIPDTAAICSYPNSLARNYAEKYNRQFVELQGEPSVDISYEITPLLAPFNDYFFVRTDNPDPTSFRFVDKASVYGEDCIIERTKTQYEDIIYDDPETLRVNGGYIFSSGYTDGGEVSLQIKNMNGSWEELGITFVLPALYDHTDYLINTYATESGFFENMDAVQSGFKSICLYSGSYIRGELYRANTFWSMSNSPHIDQTFYIQSPYSRKENKSLFASALYPFRYDSLGFPSIMATVSKRLDSSSSYKWSDSSHYTVNVTYDGETHSYGGAGSGKGQGISKDKINRFFTFDDSDEEITLDNIRQLLDYYGELEMEDDIPKDDMLTWSEICNTVGDGAWVRIIGIASIFGGYYESYTYLYKKNDNDSFSASDSGYGGSLYYGGSLGYYSDAWVDGRYIDKYEDFVPGETFEDHPNSDIVLTDVVIPVITYDRKGTYNRETGEYEYTYSNVEIVEESKRAVFYYDDNTNIWMYYTSGSSAYTDIVNMIEEGLID